MRVTVAVLTYNREDLFRRTISSLKATKRAYERVIVDNGSTDGTDKLVATMPGGICNRDGNCTIGHGLRLAMKATMLTEPDVVVFTADDYLYCPNWLERLVDFWENAPETAGLCTLAMEPTYHWNTIYGAEQIGGQWAWRRRTVPGANWSFRASLWETLAPLVPDDSHKYDHRVCRWLQDAGYGLYALSLAEHIGAGRRSWKS